MGHYCITGFRPYESHHDAFAPRTLFIFRHSRSIITVWQALRTTTGRWAVIPLRTRVTVVTGTARKRTNPRAAAVAFMGQSAVMMCVLWGCACLWCRLRFPCYVQRPGEGGNLKSRNALTRSISSCICDESTYRVSNDLSMRRPVCFRRLSLNAFNSVQSSLKRRVSTLASSLFPLSERTPMPTLLCIFIADNPPRGPLGLRRRWASLTPHRNPGR